jgi:hypothetical protein
MYYVLKLIQAAGLTFIMISFVKNFPEIMDMKMLAVGIFIFTFGWTLQKIILKN